MRNYKIGSFIQMVFGITVRLSFINMLLRGLRAAAFPPMNYLQKPWRQKRPRPLLYWRSGGCNRLAGSVGIIFNGLGLADGLRGRHASIKELRFSSMSRE